MIIFGGTGRTGRHVIDAALADGRVVGAPYLPMGFSATLSREQLGRFLVDQHPGS